jgi:hypothetical protein
LENDSSLALFHDGKSEPLSFERDAYLANRISQAPKVDAPLVFLGWGLDIPEKGYSDLQGVDLKGKVAVVLLGGSPREIPGRLARTIMLSEAVVGFEESRRSRDNFYPQSPQHGYPMGAAEGAQNSGRNGASRRNARRHYWNEVGVTSIQLVRTSYSQDLAIRSRKYRTSRKTANLFHGFHLKLKFAPAPRWSAALGII